MALRTILFLSVLLAVVVAQRAPRINCVGNILLDESFENGFDLRLICRNSSSALSRDDVRFCTVGYTLNPARYPTIGAGNDLPWWTGTANSLVNLTVPAGFSDVWSRTSGEVTMINSNFQNLNSGNWALGLNGQNAAGHITQTWSVGSSPSEDWDCSFSYSRQTNRLASIYPPFVNNAYVYSSTYQWQIRDGAGVVIPSSVTVGVAPPFGSSDPILSASRTVRVHGGVNTLEFFSTDSSAGLGFAVDENFFQYTGAIIDDLCLTCVMIASPSPAPSTTSSASSTPAPSSTSSASSTPAPSTTSSASSTPAPSTTPTAAPSTTSTAVPSSTSSASSTPAPSTTSSASVTPVPSMTPSRSPCSCPVCSVCPSPPAPSPCVCPTPTGKCCKKDTNINFDFAHMVKA